MKHITSELRDLGVRMAKLEESKISTRDLEQTYAEVDELRQKKADKAIIEDHESRLRYVETRIALWAGAGIGASAVVSLVTTLLVKVLR